jgi:hypothetical protein
MQRTKTRRPPRVISTSPFPVPRLAALARHATPHLLETTLIPLGLFYGGLRLFGLWGALLAALVWSYTSLLRRLLTRRRVPGMLILAIVGMTARTALALVTGSAFLYFLQPTMGTGLVAGVFAGSVLLGRPLAQRLAADLLPLPEALLARRGVRRFFQRVSLLWAAVFFDDLARTRPRGPAATSPGLHRAGRDPSPFQVRTLPAWWRRSART